MDHPDVGAGSVAFFDALPQLDQEIHIPDQCLFGDPVGRRAGNEPLFPGPRIHAALQDVPQPPAFLLVLDLLGNAGRADGGHKDQIAGRNGDVGGKSGAFGAQGVLDHLHHNLVTLADDLADMLAAGCSLRVDDIRGVQESGPLEPDTHEGVLHTRQDAADTALVDIPHQPAVVGTLDDDLLHGTVFHHRDPGLRGHHIDKDFSAQTSVTPGDVAYRSGTRHPPGSLRRRRCLP